VLAGHPDRPASQRQPAGNTPITAPPDALEMSQDPSAAGRETPPGAGAALVDVRPATSMRADPTAREGDEPQAQPATANGSAIIAVGSPPTARVDEATSTVDALHWFG
jgi:hypothetical protein